MARPLALLTATAITLLTVAGAGGAATQQAPRRGGSVAVVMALEPSCVNLFVDPCQTLALPVFGVVEGAFKRRPDWSWQPRLVSRVDVAKTSPFTLTYHIRPEARWSDGVPVTARDFLFTHATRLTFPDAGDLDKTWIRSIRALDSKTVRVTLPTRYGDWHSLFGMVLPEHALRGEDLERVWSDRIDNPKTGSPIGNGPWLLESWRRGEQLTLVRNPRYWGPHTTYLDRVVVRFSLDPDAIRELFARGQADIGVWQFDPALVPAIRRVPRVQLRFARTSPGFEHLDIRIGPGGHPALRKKLVRRALAYAIDRVAIVRAVVGTDVETSPKPRDNLVFSGGSRFYAPNWKRYRYRPDVARRLLARAGCRPGADGIYSCAGLRLSLRIVSRGVISRRVQTLGLVQTQAKRAGIEVIPSYVASVVHNSVLESGDFDMTLFAWFGPQGDGGGLKDLYGCGGPQNDMGWCQRLVTRDLDQADRIVDVRRRARLLNGVDVRLSRDVPSIPMFEIPALGAARPTIRNFFGAFTPQDPTWNAENWWLDR